MTPKQTPKQTATAIAMTAKSYQCLDNIELAEFAVNVILDYTNSTQDSEYFKEMKYWENVKQELKKL